jgi:hypothetical protein
MSIELANGISNVTNGVLLLSEKLQAFSREVCENDNVSSLHLMWIVPVNLGLSLIGIAIAPIAFTINALMALIFHIASSCSEEWQKQELDTMSGQFRILAAMQLESPLTYISRIFVPDSDVHPVSEHVY